MKTVIALSIALLVVFTGPSAFSQQTDTVLLTPGHRLLKGKPLNEGATAFIFLLTKNGQQQKVGGLKEELRIVTHGERKAICGCAR
ncbi:hypothetical protein [Paraflavitalea speifideaquila]|uniref:hypothetical protein n=1 Tax=Paraflavitalea speifideaquila TaxID=3076558 RepID=UPI0028E21FC7|nr:hypothetical protein [Paraflavitalea speifideiaquila]